MYIHLTLHYMAAFTMSAPLNDTLEPRKCSYSYCCNILPPPEPHKKFFSTCDSCCAWDAAYKKRKWQADKDHANQPAPPPPGQSLEEQEAGGAAIIGKSFHSWHCHSPLLLHQPHLQKIFLWFHLYLPITQYHYYNYLIFLQLLISFNPALILYTIPWLYFQSIIP